MNCLRKTLFSYSPVLSCNVNKLVGMKSMLQERHINYIGKVMPPLEDEGAETEKTSIWLSHNEKIFPPQSPEEERRPAYVCHVKTNIKYSPDKMWYIACLVRGMSVDEALRQLNFVYKKGAGIAKDTILEAQQLAVEEHYVEYKSNLWVAESFVGKGPFVKGIRRHARQRIGEVRYKYCHYFVRLEEGKPPLNYYNKPPRDRETLLQNWLNEMRMREVTSSL